MKNDIHDLGLLLDSRVKLVLIESWEEQRVLETIGTQAIRRGCTWYTWDHIDGLARLGFGAEVDQGRSMTDPHDALEHILKTGEQALFVFCDLHPFFDSPRLVRLIKRIAMNPEERAPTLVFISHALSLPVELNRMAARLQLSMPSDQQLAAIVREEAARWTAQNQGQRVRTDSATLGRVVRNLRGTTQGEARLLARRLIVDDGAITEDDLPVLNSARFALLELHSVLSFEQDTARFAEVGGLRVFRRWLDERQAAFLEEGQRDVPRGVMLVGVQGSGKSLAAKAVAGLWGLPLLRLDIAALYNKYIGETERNLREALQLADTLEPCVLWIDEIEKALGSDSSDQGVSRRLLGALLTWMAERRSRVFLVATANEVDRLPPELIRKGRIDELFFVDLPDAAVREDIFRIHLARRELDPGSFDLTALAAASVGFSGAEIEQAVVTAVYAGAARQELVQQQDVLQALAQTSPLSVVMAERIAALRRWAEGRTVMAD